MKKRFLFAAICLAGVLFVFGETTAKADHGRGGFRGGLGGYGGCSRGVAPVYGGVGYYGGYAGGYRGFDRQHHHRHRHLAPYRGRSHFGRGYGNTINVLTPRFGFGLRY